ncbi:MAG: SDR family oxidoreductase [Clostridiales bacterium]|nr:SDR family oxidoreductase [Clostridiales bacterium]
MIPFIENMQEAYDLTGKNAIVTGGNGGIGLGIAKALAECGVNIAILCRNMDKAKKAVEQVKAFGVKCQAYSCDITVPQAVHDAVGQVWKDFDGIDILINNSGIKCNTYILDMDQDLSVWHEVIGTDLNGMVQMTYEVGKRMRDAGKGGSIVNITSNAGAMVNKGIHITPYSVAKAGANHFTRCMAVELAEYDIRVNAIAPGFTDISDPDVPMPEMPAGQSNPIWDLIQQQQASKRNGTTLECGALAVFLSSPAAAMITGEVVTIDSGYTLMY